MEQRKEYKRVFRDHQELYTMLNFRLQGYSLHSLSILFHCDKMTVSLWCEKYGIFPMEHNRHASKRHSFSISDVLNVFLDPPPIDSRWTVIDGERVNRGRSYKDYLSTL